jgi:LPXTG-motif cell wall-anchored protein
LILENKNATITGNSMAISLSNKPGAALPHTGGPGTFLYTLGGITRIMASALMYGFRMRRRERRLN